MGNDQEFWSRPVREIMNSPVEMVHTKDSLHDAARLFTEHHIGAAVVENEDGKPVGVITKSDLVRYEEEKDETQTVNKKKDRSWMNGDDQPSGFHAVAEVEIVQNWMTPIIFSVKPETSVTEIAQRMVKYGIHHIFVRGVSADQILGIVSSFDILRMVASIHG
jgi:CBS domain-containing protein